MRSGQSGLTIIELLAVLAILAILLTISAPSVRELTMNTRVSSQVNDLMTDLAITRSEAIKRNVRTAICASSNGTACTTTAWNQGWIVFLDPDSDGAPAAAADILKRVPALDGGNTLTSTGHSVNGSAAMFVPFRPSGATTPGGGNVEFILCDTRTTSNVGASLAMLKGRRVRVSATGRAISDSWTCP